MLHKQFDNVDMAIVSGEHHWRHNIIRWDVDITPMLHKQCDNVGMAIVSGEHHRRHTIIRSCVNINPMLHKNFDSADMAIVSGEHNSRSSTTGVQSARKGFPEWRVGASLCEECLEEVASVPPTTGRRGL
jgi:hypothetical protein